MTCNNYPFNWLKRNGKRQKPDMKKVNNVNDMLFSHFNISNIGVYFTIGSFFLSGTKIMVDF